MLRYNRYNIVILMAATAWLMNPHTIRELKDNISHTVAAIRITMLHRVYINMLTAGLLTNCSNTLRNIHTNVREDTTRKRAKRKVGYFSWPILYIWLIKM